jgi:Double zinc ribbon
MPTLLAYFGINSSGLNLAIDLLIVFLVVLYLALIYWTYTDARRRILDPILVLCAAIVSLFPFVGPVVYIILRPPEFLEDVRERELEVHAAELRLQQIEQGLCPHCDQPIESDFLRCPSCLRKLREQCSSCKRPLAPTWSICPYCEADGPGVAKPRRSTRKRERDRAETAASVPAAPVPATSSSPPAPARRRRSTTTLESEPRSTIENESPTEESEPWTAH